MSIDTSLWEALALSDHYPTSTCWAWMDSADRVCAATEDPTTPHLCPRHATVARRRIAAQTQRAAAQRDRMTAETERMRPKADAEMATLRRRISQLNPPSRADGAVVNTPLSRRMPTDAQIAELASAWERLRRLEARFGGVR
jgi:hypothetical protein